MTVENQTPYQTFTANGSQTNFALGFYVDDKDHFEVRKNDQAVSKNDYSYNSSSNSIVFNTTPKLGDEVEIQRSTTADRATTYATYNNSFRPEVLNKDIDRIWLKVQELGVADILLKAYTDKLHNQQKQYIDSQDQAIINIVNDLRNYVNQQDNDLGQHINSLKVYSDDQDNKLKNHFDNLVTQQGVSLTQLNDYYHYVLKEIANIGEGKGWLASLVVDVSGKTQQEINDITLSSINILSHGGRSDAHLTTKIGTDNFDAIKTAVIEANLKGKRVVKIPSGDWYVKLTDLQNTINLSQGVTAQLGVRIVGDGKEVTRIWVDAESKENILFLAMGGSASTSSRGIYGVTIKAIPSNRYKGIAYRMNGACFTEVDDFEIGDMYVGYDLLNGTGIGTFCEFNILSNGRLNANKINRRYIRDEGDNSFHGNNVINVQNQVKTNGGIGTQVTSSSGPAYLYNQNWIEHYFGGTGCIALDLTNCNTDNLWGNLTHEGALTIRTNDNSNFHFKGNFSGIGSLNYDIANATDKGFGNIIFDNTSSLLTTGQNFTNSTLAPYIPRPMILGGQDRYQNGVTEAIYRIGEGIGFNTYYTSPGWFFTQSSGGNILSVNPSWKLNANGTEIKSYAATTGFSNTTATFKFGPSSIYPATGTLSLGDASYGRWSSLLMTGIDFSSTSLKPHITNTLIIGASNATVKDIFIQNAPTVVSDQNYKANIKNLSDALLDAWGDLNFSMWQLNSAIAEKGEAEARWHIGLIAQQVKDALTAHGLDWTRYGLITHESWDATEEVAYKPSVID